MEGGGEKKMKERKERKNLWFDGLYAEKLRDVLKFV